MHRPKRVLIVCTGNVCRSPMAYGLLRHYLAQKGLDQEVVVETAGTHALDNQPPTRLAQEVMAARGIDITDHRARTATPEMLAQADVILVMSEQQRQTLFHRLPDALPRILLLSELVGEHKDIPDPYGGPREEYEMTAALLETYITRGLPALLRRLGLTVPDPPAEDASGER